MTQDEVIPLLDGCFEMDVALFPDMVAHPDLAARLMGLAAPPASIAVPVWAFLIRTAEGPVLVDAGGGAMMGAGFGAMAVQLARSGVSPCDITRVYLTHLHGDHCGGLLDSDGGAAFANARIAVSEAEVAFWTGGAVPEAMAAITQDAERVLAAYAGRIDRVLPGQQVGAARAIAAGGHTPGHVAWDFARQQVIAAGDILHHAAVQLAHPDWGSDWDMDRDAATATRLALIALATDRRADLLCGHGGRTAIGARDPVPGIDHIQPGPLMSQATISGGIAWLAGQIGTGGPHETFEAECRAALAAADALLAQLQSHRGALLHVTVHVRDLDLMRRFNPVWMQWLDGCTPPARVAVETRMVDPSYSVAISCIARANVLPASAGARAEGHDRNMP